MKKIYRKGTVHPSPPPLSSSQSISDHHLAFLPATILTLTVALSPQDKEVLAYLISCSTTSCLFPGNRRNTHKSSSTTTTPPAVSTARGAGSSSSCSSGASGDHPTQFNCNCFRCYTSYWVRWDSSPNRQLIHEIIDAFEDSLVKKEKNKKDRRKKVTPPMTDGAARELPTELIRSSETELSESNSMGNNNEVGNCEVEKGSVRKIVNFLGERIWGVWT